MVSTTRVAKGSFEVMTQPEPPYDNVDGVSLGRVHFEKRFSGPLDATSKMQMLAARTPVEGSVSYAAVERITGSLDGKRGTFVVVHAGVTVRGQRSLLSITIVPDSGTGELSGISGRMDVQVVEGKHFYELNYNLDEPPCAIEQVLAGKLKP
jgi:hypothetical protein